MTDKDRKIRIDGMLLATLLTNLFYSATYPYIHKQVMECVSDSIIALNQIINCLSIIIIGAIWNRKSKKLFNLYPLYCILETLVGIVTTVYVIISKNIVVYYILDTLVFAIITRNIICGGIKLRAIRYDTEDKREHFDNNNNSMSAIATILGSVIAMFLTLNFNTMIILATIGNCIDNIFYIVIWYKTNKQLKR